MTPRTQPDQAEQDADPASDSPGAVLRVPIPAHIPLREERPALSGRNRVRLHRQRARQSGLVRVEVRVPAGWAAAALRGFARLLCRAEAGDTRRPAARFRARAMRFLMILRDEEIGHDALTKSVD